MVVWLGSEVVLALSRDGGCEGMCVTGLWGACCWVCVGGGLGAML